MAVVTFWDNNHPLKNHYNKLYDDLVPLTGNCDSIQGELLRAASRINYDWFNNGWNYNNWSGAVIFLKKFIDKLPVKLSSDMKEAFDKSLSWVYNYSHGEPTRFEDVEADFHVTTIMEAVMMALIDNPEKISNTSDMFDFQEADADIREDTWDD